MFTCVGAGNAGVAAGKMLAVAATGRDCGKAAARWRYPGGGAARTGPRGPAGWCMPSTPPRLP